MGRVVPVRGKETVCAIRIVLRRMLGMRRLHDVDRRQTKTAQLVVGLYSRQIGEQEADERAERFVLRRLSAVLSSLYGRESTEG